jgi:hypothetical protein
MSEDTANPEIALEHFGDHHQAHLLLQPGEQKIQITGGAVLNFSDHAALSLHLDPESKASAVFGHSGDTHAFRVKADTAGNFEGLYEDKHAGVSLNLSGNAATLKQGNIPEAGITIQGDHHKTALKLDAQGQVSGTVESRNTQGANFKLELEAGKIKSGTFIHKGNSHESNVTLSQSGWSASVAADRDDCRWSMSINRGQAGLTGAGQLQVNF